MATTEVSEREARQVAEAARETDWEKPSFGKELFLGNFQLDLIHPQPRQDQATVEKGEAFLARLRAFLQDHVDPLQIERDAKIPDEVIQGLKDLGALGMKVSEEYGGLGLSQVYYNKALALAGSARRPVFRVDRAIFSPCPSLPISASLGTKTSSRSVTEFSMPRRPMNLLRCSTVIPGRSVGTMNALMPPRWPSDFGTTAITTTTSAIAPLVAHSLRPFRT